MVNSKMKERLRMLTLIEEDTRTDVVVELDRSRHLTDPGVNVWQWPWASGAAILSRN